MKEDGCDRDPRKLVVTRDLILERQDLKKEISCLKSKFKRLADWILQK